MTFFKKILSAAVIATFAMSVAATSASAHNPNNHKSPGGIFPALLGPVGAAALFPATTTHLWTTTLSQKYFYKWSLSNVFKATHQAKLLHKTGFHIDLDLNKKGIKLKGSKDVKHSKSKKGINGKVVVGCIMGSAFGAITASMRKATALGNPPRFRTQAEHERIVASGYEKQFELTSDEAQTALALCGLGSFALHWQPRPRT